MFVLQPIRADAGSDVEPSSGEAGCMDGSGIWAAAIPGVNSTAAYTIPRRFIGSLSTQTH